MKIERRDAKDLYKKFRDISNKFAASGRWPLDIAIITINYLGEIQKTKRYFFRFQRRKAELENFIHIYETDGIFRDLLAYLINLDKGY